LASVQESLGDVHHRLGSDAQAEAAYRAVRRLAAADAVAEARLMLKLSWVQGRIHGYSRALRWLTRGLRVLDGLDGEAAARQRARLMAWYGRFCQDEGRHGAAIEWCRRAIAAGEAAHDKEALAHAYMVLDWAYTELGRLDEATNSIQALKLYEELGDLSGQASVLNSIGVIAYWRGDWVESLDFYQRAQAILERIGDAVRHGVCTSNIGEIALDQGRLDEAETLLAQASRELQASGYRSGAAVAKMNLARVAARSGRYVEARALFEASLCELRAADARASVVEATAKLAECNLLAGDTSIALSLADETLERARTVGGVVGQVPLLHRIRGAAYAMMGDSPAAREALQTSLAAGRSKGDDYETALTLRTLGHLTADSDDGSSKRLLRESQVILDRLGVQSVPDLLTVERLSPAAVARC
jgi:tetratricopeptide (TPR) repeat protein